MSYKRRNLESVFHQFWFAFDGDKLERMIFLVLILVCGVFCEFPVTTVLPELQPETLTTKETGELNAGVTMKPRQNDVDYEIQVSDENVHVEETISTTTLHFTQMACTIDHQEWMSCGPRCYQTCAFQPRGSRVSRAICEVASVSNCYPGCFCASGYVRLNERCVLPVECPSEYFKSLSNSNEKTKSI